MSIKIKFGPDFDLNLKDLKDLKHDLLTEFNLITQTPSDFKKPLSEVPDTTKIDVQYDSGNQEWDVNAVAFTLSGGVGGGITVYKSGKLYDYTDSFPTEVQLGLDTKDNSDSSTASFSVESGAIYVGIELDFSIAAGVSFTSAATSFGLSANASASTSDSFTVAFYKKCAPTDILSDAIGQAFTDLILPFHSETLQRLQVGDILRHTAGANLNLGMGAGIGFGSFSVAQQWTKGIKNLANSPTLTVGVNPTATASASLAYSFGYAGTFEQTLSKVSDQSVQLHIYKSTEKTHTVAFAAGITANANISAAVAVNTQILNAPKNATSDPILQKALTSAFNAAGGAVNDLAKEINGKISKLLAPVNQDLTIELDAQISSTDQRFLLTDYTIDLTKNFAGAWKKMIDGDFVAALADTGGAVQLAVGSGLEKLYNRTASISLNFFGQALAQWSKASIENSKLVYAGNNIFHLITADGVQQRSLFGDRASEIDFYFSLELDVSGSGGATEAAPDLNIIMKATSNPEFGLRIAKAFAFLTRGMQDIESLKLQQQILDSRKIANSTQVLHLVIPEQAYKALTFSRAESSDDAADRNNYAKFAAASNITMPEGSPARFQLGHFQFDYEFWRIWNIAVTNQFPPPDRSEANRKGTGPDNGARGFLDPKFGDSEATRALIGFTMNSASEFMNLCESLTLLCGDEVTIANWEDFAKRLGNIAKDGPDFDFIVPTALALTQLCGSGRPTVTVGPAPGLTADTSIGVTMTLAGNALAAASVEKETATVA